MRGLPFRFSHPKRGLTDPTKGFGGSAASSWQLLEAPRKKVGRLGRFGLRNGQALVARRTSWFGRWERGPSDATWQDAHKVLPSLQIQVVSGEPPAVQPRLKLSGCDCATCALYISIGSFLADCRLGGLVWFRTHTHTVVRVKLQQA